MAFLGRHRKLAIILLAKMSKEGLPMIRNIYRKKLKRKEDSNALINDQMKRRFSSEKRKISEVLLDSV